MVVLDNYHQRRCGFFIQVFGLILQSTLYANKWTLLAIVTAFMYFLSIAIFKGVTSTNIDEQAGIYISAGLRVLLLTSSVYFIPQLPLRK